MATLMVSLFADDAIAATKAGEGEKSVDSDPRQKEMASISLVKWQDWDGNENGCRSCCFHCSHSFDQTDDIQ
jgi:hypothetical protein